MPIRPFTPADATACVSLMRANAPRWFSPAECDDFARTLREGDMTGFHVLEAHGEVVACGGIWIEADEEFASLYWVTVRPDLHGTGLGRALVEHLLGEVRRAGDPVVVCLDTTEAVTGFYERFGFRITAAVERGYDDGKTRYDMELRIADSRRESA